MAKYILTILLFHSLKVCSQSQNSYWCFGDSCKIYFDTLGNKTVGTSGLDCRGSCSTLSDTSGNLLIYAFGRYEDDSSAFAFNKFDSLAENCGKLAGVGFYHDILLLRTSVNDSLIYYFHTGHYTTAGLYYTVINLNQNFGTAVSRNNHLISNSFISDCLQSLKHGNGRDWWLLTKMSGGFNSINRFYVFKVTPYGIDSPIVQDFGNASDRDLQKIYFNNQGNKLMNINITGLMTEYDFDRCTGILSNPNIIFPEQTSNIDRWFWEGAYSPNDSLFYVTKTWYSFPNDTSLLLQFNLFATDIPASCDTLWQIKHPVTIGAIRLAPDKKMYVTCAYDWGFPLFPYPDSVRNMYNENLGVINYPDSIGKTCNFQPFSFYLGGKRTYWGLPNNPNYSLGRLLGSACDTLQWVGEETPKSPLGDLIQIAPNPFTSIVNIELSDFKNDNWQLKIVDAMGQEILLQNIVKENTEVDLRYLNSGIYFVMVYDRRSIFTQKIIKE